MLSPSTNQSSSIVPLLKAHEQDVNQKTQVDTSKAYAQPSTIFQKFLDTGNTIFKDAAGAAYQGITSLASMPVNAALDLVSSHVTADNEPEYQSYLSRIDKVQNTIAKNETGGVKGDPYLFTQPSGVKAYGNALGKYQVIEAELHTYAPMFLGQQVSPAQFLASPQLQDMYMNHKISHLIGKNYTDAQIFDAHRGGMSKPRTQITHPGYVNAASENFASVNQNL